MRNYSGHLIGFWCGFGRSAWQNNKQTLFLPLYWNNDSTPMSTYLHTGWAKKVSHIIFAITLSTASQFPQFLAHIHYRKFATRRCIVSPPNTVCVTALPCKILIMTLPICLYMYTTINNNKYKHICTLDIIYVKKRHNVDYGTLLKCYPWP